MSGTVDDPKILIRYDLIEGVRLRIDDESGGEHCYDVTLTDTRAGGIRRKAMMYGGSCVIFPYRYHAPWRLEVRDAAGGGLLVRQELSIENKRVGIRIHSEAHGDSLAWMPAVALFAAEHGCEVIVQTPHRHFWAESPWPAVTFVESLSEGGDLAAVYDLGFGHPEQSPDIECIYPFRFDPTRAPLWMTAVIQLGLGRRFGMPTPFPENRELYTAEALVRCPLYDGRVAAEMLEKWRGVGMRIGANPLAGKDYVVCAVNSTLRMKYWLCKGGWERLAAHCGELGVTAVLLSHEPEGYAGVDTKFFTRLPDYRWETVAAVLKEAKAFVGVSTGLLWLAWQMGVPAICISGFTPEWYELPLETPRYWRAAPRGKVCRSCFSKQSVLRGGFDYCPAAQDFECSQTIEPGEVIEALEAALGRRIGEEASHD